MQEMRFRIESKDQELAGLRQELSTCQRTKDSDAQKLNLNHERELRLLKDDLNAKIEKLTNLLEEERVQFDSLLSVRISG